MALVSISSRARAPDSAHSERRVHPRDATDWVYPASAMEDPVGLLPGDGAIAVHEKPAWQTGCCHVEQNAVGAVAPVAGPAEPIAAVAVIEDALAAVILAGVAECNTAPATIPR